MSSIIDDIVLLKSAIENNQNIILVSDAIRQCRFCVCAGTGRTGLVMKGFAQRLSQIGFKAFDISDSNLPNISYKDLLICASFRGENPITRDFIDIAIKNKSKVIYITEHPQNIQGVIEIKMGLDENIVKKYFFGSIFEIALWIFCDCVVNIAGKGKIPAHTNLL